MIQKSLIFLFFIAAVPSVRAANRGNTVASIDRPAAPLSSLRPLAAPSVTERYEYYEVQGDTVKDVRCDMDRKGCRWEDGRTYDSVTKWSMKWDYDYNQSGRSCAPSSFRASVDILYRLPKWRHDEGVALPIQEIWERYLRSLQFHEEGHRDLAVESAIELGWAVDALPPADTCEDLDNSIRQLSRAYIARLNAEQKEYDQETGHGTTQGALFR